MGHILLLGACEKNEAGEASEAGPRGEAAEANEAGEASEAGPGGEAAGANEAGEAGGTQTGKAKGNASKTETTGVCKDGAPMKVPDGGVVSCDHLVSVKACVHPTHGAKVAAHCKKSCKVSRLSSCSHVRVSYVCAPYAPYLSF